MVLDTAEDKRTPPYLQMKLIVKYTHSPLIVSISNHF